MLRKGISVGSTVSRNLEGIWFTAVVEKLDTKTQSVTIRYLDDGNVEDCVPIKECMEVMTLKSSASVPNSLQAPPKVKMPPVFEALVDFIEDDYDERNSKAPTVTIHQVSSQQSVKLEKSKGAGSGLKAVRSLKTTDDAVPAKASESRKDISDKKSGDLGRTQQAKEVPANKSSKSSSDAADKKLDTLLMNRLSEQKDAGIAGSKKDALKSTKEKSAPARAESRGGQRPELSSRTGPRDGAKATNPEDGSSKAVSRQGVRVP